MRVRRFLCLKSLLIRIYRNVDYRKKVLHPLREESGGVLGGAGGAGGAVAFVLGDYGGAVFLLIRMGSKGFSLLRIGRGRGIWRLSD